MNPSASSISHAACTIIARNYLAQARVLANSYLQHQPDSHFFVLVLDGLPAGVDLGESVTVLGPEHIGLAEFSEMSFKYDVTELATAVKPALLATLLNDFRVEHLVYFDPDIVVFRPLSEMWDTLASCTILLIPHLLDPIPRDGCLPSEQDILIAGAYNLGFIGVRNSAEASQLLDWWRERLRDDCRVDVAHGLFVDQKWIDLVPSLFPGSAVLRDRTYDVAYWNLHSRSLERDADGGFLVDGRPLAFFHYSGFDPDRPRDLSRHQTRHTVAEHSPLANLLDLYVQALKRVGFASTRTWPYGYARFDNGIPISRLHRHLYGQLEPERRRAFGDPFQTSHPDSFFQWSTRPGSDGLNPFLEQLLAESLEARLAFPDARSSQLKPFLAWAQTHGVERFGYDPRLADPAAWRALPVGPAADHGQAGSQVRGVNVCGYLTNETGLGAAGRGFVRALRRLGVPVGLRDLPELSPNRSQDTSLGAIDGQTPYGINLVVVNADQHFVVKSHLGEDFFKDHYNIGCWFWELPSFPPEWADRFDEYDEIWASSSFIANTLASVSPIPVVHMPFPLVPPSGGSRQAGRQRLGVGPDTFVFLFIFDFASYFERKNPLAIIRALQHAFGPEDNVRLVLKCVNEQLSPEQFAAMQAAVGDWPVPIFSGYWSPEEMADLMQACDAYVSLHRSEGLGHTMAEAMAVGKPVIATDWSGNTDFMSVANSFPVAFELVELDHDVGPYRAGSIWAEPSVDDAARLMRLVYDDRELARARGEAGRRHIATRYSEERIGEALQARLEVAASRQQRRTAPRELRPVEAPARARTAPIVPPMELASSSHGRLGILLKRGVDVLLRYHTHYQGEINLAFAAFMRQLAAEHDAVAAEVKTLAPRAQVTALENYVRSMDKRLTSVTNDVARHESYFSGRPYMAIDAYGAHGDLSKPMGFETPSNGHPPADQPDFSDLFRGAESFIADRQRIYLRFFKDAQQVVDLGAGRGEFLELLRDAGIDAVGVETDPAMVERARGRQLRMELADAYDYLQRLPERSQDVIFSAQFIEHVPSERLSELLELARSRLRDQGLFIAETVNPESHLGLKTFHVDLTHQRPIYPQVLLYLTQAAGYRSARIFYPNAGGFTQAAYRDAGEYAIIAVN